MDLTDKELLILEPFIYKLQKNPDFILECFPELIKVQEDSATTTLYYKIMGEIVKRNLARLSTPLEIAKHLDNIIVEFDTFSE